ncbi:MAG TPA: hypothetical protein VJP07_00155 [Dehalococcoidia bacterium]|nr:hypothetical protein [Dehalococcoidia bacterium]
MRRPHRRLVRDVEEHRFHIVIVRQAQRTVETILSAQPVLSEPPVEEDAPPLLRAAH